MSFIDSARFMASSLSNHVNNLSDVIHKIKSKYGHDDKKCEFCGITCKICDCFLEYTHFKEYLIEYKCCCCNKNYQQKFDEKLTEQFLNTYKFSNHDNNNIVYCINYCIIVLLRCLSL